MIIALAIVLAIGAIAFTLLIRERDVPEPIPVSPIQHLDDRKRAIYDNLRDLQFEYRLGKLSDQDYSQTKQALQRELAGVLAQTEQTVKALGLAPVPQQAAAKQVSAKQIPAKPAGVVCPSCGASFPQALKFCGECGKAMA